MLAALVMALIVAVIVLAQVAEQRSSVRLVLRGMMLLVGLATMLAGMLLFFYPNFFDTVPQENAAGLGGLALVTGLLLLFPLRFSGVSWLRPLALERPTPLVVWGMMVLFLSSNMATAMTGTLSDTLPEHPLSFLLLQNALTVLMVLLGVGWGFRRSGRAVAQRLGLARPTLHMLLLGAGMALVMLINTGLVGGVIALIFGSDYGAGGDFNQQIINGLPGIGGVILMGLITGTGEEMLYRGALQPVLGIGLTSLLFALSHAQYLNPALVIIFSLGLLLGFTRKRWGLGAAILAHAVYNTLIGLFALWSMNS